VCVHGRWAVRGVSIIAWRPDCLYLPSSKPAIPHLFVRSSPALRQQEEMGFTGSLKRTQEHGVPLPRPCSVSSFAHTSPLFPWLPRSGTIIYNWELVSLILGKLARSICDLFSSSSSALL